MIENVPKIVKERLKAVAIAVDHPDPDVLTTFSESLLADRERNQVLEHLARCAECREVLALAQSTEEPVAVVVRPIRRGWLTWPQLRWGLVAAGVIVVGSFGVLRYERSKPLAPVAALSSARTDEIATGGENQTELTSSASEASPAQRQFSVPPAKLAEAESKPQATADAKKEFDREETAKLPALPSDKKAGGAGGFAGYRGQALPHGPMPPAQWQQNANLNANAANQQMRVPLQAPVPATPLSANEQGTSGVLVSTQPSPASKAVPAAGASLLPNQQAQKLDTLAMQGRSVAPLPSVGGSTGGEVARAKDAQPPAANVPKTQAAEAAYDVSAASSSNFSTSGTMVPESARWAINSVGGLQRSLDQGKTWQDVDVNKGSRDSADVNVSLAMKSSRAKAAALQKQKADLTAKPVIFRAVSANGPDVWAGGSEGNLYHSTDSGAHWVRVLPSWRGVELSGDILSLQFAEPQHGRIVTSSAEIWTTADAGQTWDKQ